VRLHTLKNLLFSSCKNQALVAPFLFGVQEPPAERDTENFAAAASPKMLIQLKKYNIKMPSHIILPFN
jgi:hypothetical protein